MKPRRNFYRSVRLARLWTLCLLSAALFAAMACPVIALPQPADLPSRTSLHKQLEAGNFKDAYEGFRRLATDPINAAADDSPEVGEDLAMACRALQELGRLDELDDFRESVVRVHAKNWRALRAAAHTYLTFDHSGTIVAGRFRRGPKAGQNGEEPAVNAIARDRARALQLLAAAMPLADADSAHADTANLYLDLAHALMSSRSYNGSWQLQTLTDLTALPDYEPGWSFGESPRGAPVDANDAPILYPAPKRWTDAANDGQRWRWALAQAVARDPQRLNTVRWELAQFFQSQFGVETLADYRELFDSTDDSSNSAGDYSLQTLAADETIARLATGVKRFKLPDEFNPIRIYQQIAAEPQTGHGVEAVEALAGIFENRRQYDRAADYWQQAIREYGPGPQNSRRDRLDQIVGNWGRFESGSPQVAGRAAKVDFRFRNGRQVSFEAHAIKLDTLLADVKAYLKSNPRPIDGHKIDLQDIGARLVQENQQQYVGAKVAAWDLELQPRRHHFDRRITVTTPLQTAGAYLLTAQMANGNSSQIILWLDDMVIVKKPLADGTFYYVGNASSGQPIAKANVELFGYRQLQPAAGKPAQVETVDFADQTDADGQLLVKPRPDDHQFNWLFIATAPTGRFAYLGFTNIASSNLLDTEYNETKVFAISDRPVYRPGQTAKFKFWVRHAKYDQADTSEFANQSFTVEIHNPKGEKLLSKTMTTDAYGGLDGEFAIPQQATLGVYQFSLAKYGGGSFRVEEYKKPEYEVSIETPAEPVTLGQKAKATIRAKYYFGSPVTHAVVKYKILRSRYNGSQFPSGEWDWLYGPGYWWFGYDYDWYPGWAEWGCPRPTPSWWSESSEPQEVVAEREVPIGADGTVAVDIDTAFAKAIHPDQDHQYEISAEVIDASRQTVVGSGRVLASRKPFQVFVSVDRGYYHVDDVVRADCFAQAFDGKPVRGDGKLSLAKIAYKDGKPQESPVRDWNLSTGADGRATLQIKASEPGQYRLSFKLTDEQKRAVEGGYLFTIVGQGAGPGIDTSNFRFNDLELVPDRQQYAPDETVNLMVNTARPDSAVLLFVRPVGGVYLPPKLLRLTGKSIVEQIRVLKRDMPNFFVEALTIADGKLFTEARQIIVPPESRVLNVAVQPSRDIYKPGQPSTVSLKLTDPSGHPLVGSVAVAIYDKALEYISGGSNVENIKDFFWRWTRSHEPNTETSLLRSVEHMTHASRTPMDDLGVFGGALITMNVGAADAGGGRPGGGAMARGYSADTKRPSIQPTVRSNFADTALWVGALETNDKGEAEVSLTMPENLTTWRVKVWGMGHGTKVGEGSAEVVTRKNLIIRLEAPRFFVEKDEVVLSGNVHNYLKTKKQVQAVLEVPGHNLVPMADLVRTVEVPAGGETRVEWRVKVVGEGEATVRMKALTDEESDAVEQKFPVYVHGMLKMDSFSGVLRPNESEGKITFNVPAERRQSDSVLEVRYSPTLAGAMVDALPYLADYPYDCTEQTLNRFLPTVITQRILIRMGLDLKKIQEKRTNLNAQEIGDDRARAAGWKRFDRNPVFDNEEVTRMVRSGVERLEQMQLTDGGWGWFSGVGEQSWPHTTATVVHGLQVAKANDVALAPGVMERGVEWLKRYQEQQVQLLENALNKPQPTASYKTTADNLDAFVYMVLVDAGVKNPRMMDFLYRDRIHLAVYAKALFGLALEKQADQKEKLAMILQNIRQFVVEDNEDQTAYLKLPEDNYWWLWFGSEVEADAYYLKLLTRTDPKGELAPRLVKYLLNNRKHATYWNSTRDTGLAIEALADYLRASGEDKPDVTVEVLLDGKKQKEVHITATDLFTFDNKFVLHGDAVTSGNHELQLRNTGTAKKGAAPLYYNAYLTTFTLEDWIGRAGLEVRVHRKVYKLERDDKTIQVAGGQGQAVGQRVEKYKRIELKNLDMLKSGDLVEVELEIDSKNDYEYVLFEDMKAAGFEPMEVRSGYSGNALGAYMELRDNRVSFFMHELPRGKHSVSYRLRAEIPGRYSALPARASAMYAPELKGNSDEIKFQIGD